MKAQILGMVAVCALAGPMTAGAVVVTISGQGSADGTWNVITTSGSYNGLAGQLGGQPWWQNLALANAFALAVGSSLGFPNRIPNFPDFGPAFVHLPSSTNSNDFWTGRVFRGGELPVTTVISRKDIQWTFAIASRVGPSVPEPGTIGLLTLGLLGLLFSMRRVAKPTS